MVERQTPDLNEKLLTGTLSLSTNKQNKQTCHYGTFNIGNRLGEGLILPETGLLAYLKLESRSRVKPKTDGISKSNKYAKTQNLEYVYEKYYKCMKLVHP